MKLQRNTVWMILGCVFTLLIMSACQNTPEFEESRPEYDYVPPVRYLTPTPEPVANDETTEKRGFFSKLFSKSEEDEGDQATVSRVGDAVENESERPETAGQNNQPRDNIYRLKTGDALFVSLTGSGGLDESIETIIDDEGSIKLRFIGSVKASGLSSTELEREIEAEYTERQKIYKDVTVRVVVPNNFYFIGGEVRQPGRFPLVGRVTLSQAITAAGNFTEWADESDLILVRNNERVVINYKQIRQNPNLDVELLPGDTITVGRSFL